MGDGFAGVWSAAGAVRLLREHGANRSVGLLTPGSDLVLRPRLYEPGPRRMRVPLDRLLDPVGVRRIAATATAVDTARRRVTATIVDGTRTEIAYGRPGPATGSRLVRPAFPETVYAPSRRRTRSA
ncbi:hypothetical protein ACH4GK_36535 [Streptomyces rimosus]|uniref:hypothetical protein n=1 Tax=Streptomyces rimosus TaxID=1927 RepID=UPI000A779B21|nr:hypothetical protein [Streptomyces rimosus]